MSEIVRDKHLANEILFIDGSWGTGKSILGPVLGAFDRVEKQKIDHIFEYVATMDFLGRMQRDASKALMNMYADINLFNSMISREVNFRWGDDSGVFKNPKTMLYLSRLFESDGDRVKDEIRIEKPIVQIMSHHLLHVSDSVFDAFGSRVKFVEMVRHPVYMISHWYNYLGRLGKDEREFTVWIKGKKETLPWFIFEGEEEFNKLNPMDRVIFSLWQLDKLMDKSLAKVSTGNVLVIPFENFVTNPDPVIEKLKVFLNVLETDAMAKTLERQKCPRTMLSAGRGHKSYGWSPVDDSMTDRRDYESRLEFVKAEASPFWLDRLIELGDKYLDTYPVKGIGPWKS